MDGSLAYLQAQMKRPWGWWFKRWERDKQKWAEQLGEGRSYWQKMRLILPNLGEMLGMAGGRKDYLILLQNEMELRPTGGFIGSLAILTFQDGRMMNLEVLDVYSADGQLKGHVEPPAEIKEYLGEANWYLRDVNWDPDFAVVAGKAEWFFEKEMGRKVDGVIAFNLGAAKAMLAAMGKVSLGDYGEEITADNLFEQAEFYAENKFFPGSQEKANFLGLLAKELLVELKSSGPEEWGRLALGMVESLEEKEIQIFLNDKDSQRNLETLGWDGRVREVVCKGENCVSDYLMIVEANLGVNKANYFIKRLVEQVVELTAASINRTVKISYENTARSDAWPAGIYKNYVRVFLPGDVRVLGVKIRDLGTGVEEEVKWTEKRYGSKKELGFLVKVPVSGKRQVEVSYQTVRAITGEELRYAYLLQKQSGWQETNLNLLITADSQWRPLQVQPAASLVGGKLLFSELLDRDLEIGVEWGK